MTTDQLKAGLAELRTEVAGYRAEVTVQIADVTGQIAEQRADTAEVRTEIANLDTRLSTQIAEVWTEIAGVRTEVTNLETRLIRWMVGTVIATCTSGTATSTSALAHRSARCGADSPRLCRTLPNFRCLLTLLDLMWWPFASPDRPASPAQYCVWT